MTNDDTGFNKYFGDINYRKLEHATAPGVAARYFGCFIIEGNIKNKDISTVIDDAFEFHSQLIRRKDNFRNFTVFEYVLNMILLCVGYANESLFYSEFGLKHYKEIQELDKSLCKSLEFIKAFPLVKLGRRKESEKLFNKLRPSSFYFLTRKTATIVYLILSKYLNKTTPKTEIQLN